MPGPDVKASNPLTMAPSPVAGFGGSVAPPTGGMAGMAGMASEDPPFSGQPCSMGDSQVCTCEDGVSQGTQSCQFEFDSPTKGAFGPCSSCQQAGPAPTGGMSAAGMGGAAGMGAAGTGSSGTGGASGTGGTGGQPTQPDRCDPDDCPDPLLGSACCTDDDECGVRLLLSCNAR
jgi:hypothetical protein